jgi:AraC-like DNA-binding protein
VSMGSLPLLDAVSQFIEQLHLRCFVTHEQAMLTDASWEASVPTPGFCFVVDGPPCECRSGDDRVPLAAGEVCFFFDSSKSAKVRSSPHEGPTSTADSVRDHMQRVLLGTLDLSRAAGLNAQPGFLAHPARAGHDSASTLARFALTHGMAEATTGEAGGLALVNQLLTTICLDVVRSLLAEDRPFDPSWLAALTDADIGSVTAQVLNAPEQNWSVKVMAEMAAMGRSTFARRFLELTGMTPMDAVAGLRMQRGQDLLRTTLSLKQIAKECGYSSISAFAASFKRRCGMTPKVYRAISTGSTSTSADATA